MIRKPIDIKSKIAELNVLKKNLSKEILEDTFTAADQAYNDLWATEKLNQITKLQAFTDQLSQENAELKEGLRSSEEKYRKLISELRTKGEEKCEEISCLIDENHKLIKDKNEVKRLFSAKLLEEDEKFEEMQEKLSCEIKILNGRVNDLEEFRLQREELTEKYSRKLITLQNLEERAEGVMKKYHRVQVLNKNRMGQELKQKLLKMSIEFQEASRTDATKNLVRENIAIKLDLGELISSWQVLHDENAVLRNQRKTVKSDLAEEKQLIEKFLKSNVLQTQVIDRLVYGHKDLIEYHSETEGLRRVVVGLEKKLGDVSVEARKAENEAKILQGYKHERATRLCYLEHEWRELRNTNHAEDLMLKRGLLYVADGQELKSRANHKRLSTEEVRAELVKILSILKRLFAQPESKTSSIDGRLEEKSVETVLDLDYAEKYWNEETGPHSRLNGFPSVKCENITERLANGTNISDNDPDHSSASQIPHHH